jgi:hypothetical protein
MDLNPNSSKKISKCPNSSERTLEIGEKRLKYIKKHISYSNLNDFPTASLLLVNTFLISFLNHSFN